MGSGCCKTGEVVDVKVSHKSNKVNPHNLELVSKKTREYTELT